MKFSEQYISICEKLPPRKPEEWEKGNFGLYIDTIVQVIDINEFGIWVHFKEKSSNYSCLKTIDPNEVIWLPSRESDWMEMEEWRGYLIYSKKEDIWQINLWDTELSNHSDPLLCCARAWEKSKEMKE
jgi:hypothetical protein